MTFPVDVQRLIDRVDTEKPNLTALRAIATEHGKDHETAEHLWAQGATNLRMLSLLIMDLKAIDRGYLERMIADVETAQEQGQRQVCDWLIAIVIMKKNSLKSEAMNWRAERSIIKQRVYWSVNARTIKAENQELNRQLLEWIEEGLPGAPETIQWNMNWCAAQIGIADEGLRGRCIALGERLGLYKDYPVSRGCTSPYLPLWIGAVVGKKVSS